jgi:CRISPR-associated protein Csc2
MSTSQTIPALKTYQANFLLQQYENLPQSRYVHILLCRETLSECVFRTEGTGEPLSREQVSLDGSAASTDRVVITKRKQVAVERRTGRELLRSLDLLRAKAVKDGDQVCLLNSNEPCERCIDCFLYGFAAGGGGAQRSRVLTEDSYSLLPAAEVIDTRTGNATYDNGTMRHPLTGEPSQALYESEYVRPGVSFLDIQTLKDVQAPELLYVLGNILRSSRYGATGTRIGHIRNHVLAVAFSRHEVISNLEWTQATTRALQQHSVPLTHPLGSTAIIPAALTQAQQLIEKHAIGPHFFVSGDALDALIAEVKAAYDDPAAWLTPLASHFDQVASQTEGKKKKATKPKAQAKGKVKEIDFDSDSDGDNDEE